MTRTDAYLDAMLRHLGAAYYESLHGRATTDDVTRAVATVAAEVNEQAGAARAPAVAQPRARGGWARKVSDLMTTQVVAVDRAATYEEIARLLAEHQVSGLPVVEAGGKVAGVVTEADLLAVQVGFRRRLLSSQRWVLPSGTAREPGLTAQALMSSPAVTIGQDATVSAAANLMNGSHLRLLPVVDGGGKLVGVVSRRDLLSVFVRPDEEVAADVRKVVDEVLLAEPGQAEVTVLDGIVTLTGTLTGPPGGAAPAGRVPLAIRLMWDIDGVVGIVNRLGEPRARAQAEVPA
jgi:CBS-domain-containing membrane protein